MGYLATAAPTADDTIRLSTEPVVLRHGSPVFLSGWLRLRFQGKKRADLRFCTLTGPCFKHSATPSMDILSDGFSVFEATITADDFSSSRITIKPKAAPRVTIIAESRDELAKWLRELTRASRRSITNDYTFKQALRPAGLGKTNLAEDRASRTHVDVKLVSKRALRPEYVNLARAEAVTLLSLERHTNIVAIRDVYESARNIYLVTEHVSGPALGELVARTGSVCEADAAIVMRDLLCALEHMHFSGAVHRMVAPDNVIVLHRSGKRHKPVTSAKLSNFELTASVEDMSTTPAVTELIMHGTLRHSHTAYVAPEVARGQLGHSAQDMWSLGVLMHYMLSGTTPLDARNLDSTEEQLRFVAYCQSPHFSGPLWGGITTGAKDLCKKLLSPDPEVRLTASQAREHPWLHL